MVGAMSGFNVSISEQLQFFVGKWAIFKVKACTFAGFLEKGGYDSRPTSCERPLPIDSWL